VCTFVGTITAGTAASIAGLQIITSAAANSVENGSSGTSEGSSGSSGAGTRPTVDDPKLQNYVDNLYKGTSNPGRVGSGTTADAVRNEILTGKPTGGTFHTIKARETVSGLTKWLRNNPGASASDRGVAQGLLDDLKNALATSKP
jgi:hypothetical protein